MRQRGHVGDRDEDLGSLGEESSGLPHDSRTFSSIDDASQAVSQIIAAGIVPAALELMDRGILDAVEAAFSLGVPPEAAALL